MTLTPATSNLYLELIGKTVQNFVKEDRLYLLNR